MPDITEDLDEKKPRAEIQRHDVQPVQSALDTQDNEKNTDTVDEHLNVGARDGNGDGASHSTTLTTTPLVRGRERETERQPEIEPEPESESAPAPDSALGRFASITRRDGRHLQEPPSLPFNLRHHKLSLSIFTFLALAECCFVPIAFYYGFSQGTNVRSGTF